MVPDRNGIADEIERIVSCPYPTQLKTLRDLLQADDAADQVARWAISKPCQTQHLTHRVLDGLRHWPYVLDILAKLCTNPPTRDAILVHEPRLLHDIILQAVRADDISSPYTTAALAMLSHSLPSHTPMPADAQSLFIQVFDAAARNPTATAMKSIHDLLHGTATHLLTLLSGKVLIHLEDQIFEILKNNKNDTSSLALYCLAVLRVMLRAAEDQSNLPTGSYDTQELLASVHLSSSQKWSVDAVRQFFDGEKTMKTLQLVVLMAMWACTDTSGQHMDGRLESLRLANEIIGAVSGELRSSWRKSNALLVRKLEEKATATGLNPALRFRVLCFLLEVNKGGFCPALVVDELRRTLIRPAAFRHAVVYGEVLRMERLVDCGVFDHMTTTTFLQNLVDFITGAGGIDILELSGALRRVLTHLTTASLHDERIIEGTMLALDVLSCGDKFQQLQSLSTMEESTTSGMPTQSTCPQAISISRLNLIHDLARLFLTATISSHQSSFTLSHDTRSLLLNLHASSSKHQQCCDHARTTPVNTPSILPIVQKQPMDNIDLPDWRQAMSSHLTLRAQTDQDALSTIFHQAIASLEARCEDIEQPLQEERRQHQELRTKFDDLNEAFAKLENDTINKDIRFNALEAERDQTLEELERAREEGEVIESRFHRLGEDLCTAKDEAEELRRAAAAEKEETEMRRAAETARRVEELQEMERLMQESREKSEKLSLATEEIRTLRKDLEDRIEAAEKARADGRELERANEEMQSRINKLSTDVTTLEETRKKLKDDLLRKEEELAQATTDHDQQVRNLEQCGRVDMDRMVEQKKKEIAALTDQHGKLSAREAEVRSQLGESLRAIENQKVRVDKRDRKIADLQKETDRLHRTCEQKNRHIADASAMRNNLMMAMGLGGMQVQPPPQSSLPHRPSRASTLHPTEQEVDASQDPSPPTPFSGDDDGAAQNSEANAMTSFASTASSQESRSGPTPKRAKVKQAVKVKTPAKQRMSAASMRSTRSSMVGGSKRQPLLALGASAGNRKSEAHQILGKGIGNEDESTFEGSELFGGTQQ